MSNKHLVFPIVFKVYINHCKVVRQEQSQHMHLIWHTCSSFPPQHHHFTFTVQMKCVGSLPHMQIHLNSMPKVYDIWETVIMTTLKVVVELF